MNFSEIFEMTGNLSYQNSSYLGSNVTVSNLLSVFLNLCQCEFASFCKLCSFEQKMQKICFYFLL